MLKSFYKNFILRAFGEYIENFDDKIVEVSSWDGNFKVENLIIKQNAFSSLSQLIGIPIEIEFGLIKKIELKVEWDKLMSSPSYIHLSDVHLIAKMSHQYDENFHEKINAKLKNYEIEKKIKEICENIFNEKMSETKFSPKITWKQKLLRNFIQNINITIDNLHLRFEENYERKNFNFGLAISKLEWINTNKNGEEFFTDYETRNLTGSMFSMINFFGFSVYFNSNGINYNDDETIKKNSNVKNFSSICNSTENEKILINYLNPKGFNNEDYDFDSDRISTSNKKILKNILPPLYKQFYDFSSKIFNFSSLEYSNQFFIIDPLDFTIKFRKNTNPEHNSKTPLSSVFIELSNDVNMKMTDIIIYDLIYLFNLRNYHVKDNPALSIKKDFLKKKFTRSQYLKILKNGINKARNRAFYFNLNHLNVIQNFKEIYYKILLNQNEYTSAKFSREELLSCKINGINKIFLNTSEMQQELLTLQNSLCERLVFKLRLMVLVKIKNLILKDNKHNIQQNEKKGFFNLFGLFSKKNNSESIQIQQEKTLDDLLNENYELIESIIEKDHSYSNYSHKCKSTNKIISLNSYKFSNFFFNLKLLENKKITENLKFSISNFVFQTYETIFSIKNILICDDIILLDESSPQIKFKYIFSKYRFLNMENNSTLQIKSCHDEVLYDNDGFLLKISENMFKLIENHFFKFYFKKYTNKKSIESIIRDKVLVDIKAFDLFLNLNFYENLEFLRKSCLKENEGLMAKYKKNNTKKIKIQKKQTTSFEIKKLDLININISKMRILFLFNLNLEDYRSFIIQHDGIKIKSDKLLNKIDILNFRFFFSLNFLILLNGINKSDQYDLIRSFNFKMIRDINIDDKCVINSIIIDEFFIIFNKITINSILEYYSLLNEIFKSNIQDEFIDYDSKIEELEIFDLDYIETIGNNKSSISNYDNEFEEALESIKDIDEITKEFFFKLPLIINSQKTTIDLKTFGIYLENIDDKHDTKFFNLIFNTCKLIEIKEYSKISNVQRKIIIDNIYFNRNNSYFEKNKCNFLITTKSNCKIGTIVEIHINLLNTIIYENEIKNLIDNCILYKNLFSEKVVYTDLPNVKSNKKSNIPRLCFQVNLKLDDIEFDSEYQNELTHKKCFINTEVQIDYVENDYSKIEIYNFSFHDLNKNFELFFEDNFKKNKSLEIEILTSQNICNVNINDFCLRLRNSVISNLKYLDDLKSYMKDIDKKLLIKKRNNSLESNLLTYKLHIMMSKINLEILLYENSEIHLKIHNICSKINHNNLDLSLFNFSFHLRNMKNVNSNSSYLDNFEFIKINHFQIIYTNDKIEINFDKEINIKVLFYHLRVIRDFNKFYMNLNNALNSKAEEKTNSLFLDVKKEIVIKLKYLEIIVIDFFLKEKIHEITNNSNFHLKIVYENIFFLRNLNGENFNFEFSFFISSSAGKIIQAFVNKKLLDDISNFIEEESGYINSYSEDDKKRILTPQNFTISLEDKCLVINCALIKVVITENLLSVLKLIKKYTSLAKHYFMKNDNFISYTNSNSKSNTAIAQLFLQILKLNFFKIKFENIHIKFKNFNEGDSGIKVQNNLNINFSFEFFFSQKLRQNIFDDKTSENEIENEILLLHDFSSKISNIEVFFSTILKKADQKVINEDNYLVYPFDIFIISEKEVNVTINSVEIDFSIKKLAMIKTFMYLLSEFSFSIKKLKKNEIKKISKRDLFKKAFFDNREIIFKINNFTFIIAKEDMMNLKLYEPLFCIYCENIKMNYISMEKISIMNNLKIEYFNSFNEYWEPVLEKTHYTLSFSNNLGNYLIKFNFDMGLNIVGSIQFLKTLKILIEDINNLEKYKYNCGYTENFISNNEVLNILETQNEFKYNLTSTQSKSSVPVQKITQKSLNYKYITNNSILFENVFKRNTYQFQIENNIGEELLMVLDEKNVIKISHMQTIPIEKVLLLQNDIFNKSPSLISLKIENSYSSVGSVTSEFKSTIQQKFKQQNEKLKELKLIKYIYFQIPQLKKTFCINLLKNNQEIEIITEIYKQIKILVTIYIDTNGRKVVSLKSPIKIKNNYSDSSLEMQLNNKEDFSNSSQLFNLILQPSAEIFVPMRFLNFNYFRIRPYIEDANYYQPYNYSDIIVKDFNILKNGRIISSCLKKNEGINNSKNSTVNLSSKILSNNKNFQENVKLICHTEYNQNDKLYQQEIILNYPLEVYNYLPKPIFFNFQLEKNNSAFSISDSNSSMFQTDPFTITQLSFISPDDLICINIMSLLSVSPYVTIAKQIELNSLKINGYSNFEYNFDNNLISNEMNKTMIKVLYEIHNKKITISFYLDYIIVNELDENVELIIQHEFINSKNIENASNNELNQPIITVKTKKLFLSNITENNPSNVKSLYNAAKLMRLDKFNYGLKKDVLNNLNNISKENNTQVNSSVRKFSIESDLLSITKKSESRAYGENRKLIFGSEVEKYNALEKSINSIQFENYGYDKILEFYNNKLPIIMEKQVSSENLHKILNENISSKISHYNSKIILSQNKNNFLYAHAYYSNKDPSTGFNLENNIHYFSSFNDDKIILKINKSEELETNFIKDVNNIYKNNYMKITCKNKNMMEILCNVKYLDEFFIEKTNKFNRSKVIFIKNKYIFVNNSGLNLIITQDQCFYEGFFIIHSNDKINFKWINFEKPLLVRLKINGSSFTNPFNIDQVGEFHLNLKVPINNSNLILKISTVDNQGRTIIYIEDSTSDPPFTILNNTNKVFKIKEKEKSINYIISEPLTTVPFCFDNITSNNLEIYQCRGGLEEMENSENFLLLSCFNINQFEDEKNKNIKTTNEIRIDLLKNENMNYILKITYNITSNYNEIDKLNHDSIIHKKKIMKNNKLKINCQFIGISFIDLTPKELMYFYIKNFDFHFSILNKKFYKLKTSIDNIQIDNSLENQYYEIIFKTMNNHYINNKSIRYLTEFSYNKMGNIIFVNKMNCEIMSDFLLNLDGIFIYEVWNFFSNVKKIFNYKNRNSNEDEQYYLDIININEHNKEDKVKILFNKFFISKITVDFSFRPSFKMMNNLSKSKKLFFLISKVENMNLIFDKFVSSGIKSLETISTILAKNFMKKNNEIITKYLLSLDILLNVSNIFKHFKYGLDTIFDSIKLKRNDSFLKIPKRILISIFNFFIISLSGLSTSILKFFLQVKNITNFYYGRTLDFKITESFTEQDLQKNWYLYKCLDDNSKSLLVHKYMFSNNLYSFLNNSLINDYKKLITINYFSHNRISNINYSTPLIKMLKFIFKLAFTPLKIIVKFSEFICKMSDRKFIQKIKMRKIRPGRYINKNSCKIEEYSETRALAHDKLIRNEKFLNIFEEIEHYFDLNNDESIILTNLRFIYASSKKFNKKIKHDNMNITSIDVSSIFYLFYEESNNISTVKVFYYDEKTQTDLLDKINNKIIEFDQAQDSKKNEILLYNLKKKNNLCIKLLTVQSKIISKRDVLKNVYSIFVDKNINKTKRENIKELIMKKV